MSKQQVLPNPSGVLGRGIVVLVDGDYQASVQDVSLDITTPGALITLPQNPTVGDTTIEVLAEVACRFTAGPAGPPLLPSDPLPVAAGSNFLLAFTRGGWRIFGGGAGMSGIAIENSGVPLAGGPFTTVNLEPGLTATNAGGGVANVTAAGGGVSLLNVGVTYVDPQNVTGTASDAGPGTLAVPLRTIGEVNRRAVGTAPGPGATLIEFLSEAYGYGDPSYQELDLGRFGVHPGSPYSELLVINALPAAPAGLPGIPLHSGTLTAGTVPFVSGSQRQVIEDSAFDFSTVAYATLGYVPLLVVTSGPNAGIICFLWKVVPGSPGNDQMYAGAVTGPIASGGTYTIYRLPYLPIVALPRDIGVFAVIDGFTVATYPGTISIGLSTLAGWESCSFAAGVATPYGQPVAKPGGSVSAQGDQSTVIAQCALPTGIGHGNATISNSIVNNVADSGFDQLSATLHLRADTYVTGDPVSIGRDGHSYDSVIISYVGAGFFDGTTDAIRNIDGVLRVEAPLWGSGAAGYGYVGGPGSEMVSNGQGGLWTPTVTGLSGDFAFIDADGSLTATYYFWAKATAAYDVTPVAASWTAFAVNTGSSRSPGAHWPPTDAHIVGYNYPGGT